MQENNTFFSSCFSSNFSSNVLEPRLKKIAETIVYLAHTRKPEIAKKIVERYLRNIVSENTMEYIVRYLVPFRQRIKCVAITKNYVVVSVDEFLTAYIFGIDRDTGEIFVNAVRDCCPCSCTDCEKTRCGKIQLIFDKDGSIETSVRSAFGFQYEIDASTISDTGVYRVQGEIMFQIENLHALRRTGRILHEVRRYLQYLVYDRIVAVLSDYGFSPEVVSIRNDMWVRLLGLRTKGHEQRVVKLLGRYFNAEYHENLAYPYMLTCNTNYGRVEAYLTIRRMKPMGERYYGLYMHVDLPAILEAENRLAEDIIENLLRIEKTNVVTRINRHIIELHGVVPLVFNYTPLEQVYVLDPVTIPIALPRHYVVVPESRAIIRHPEHGERVVRFNGVFLLRIRTSRVANIHIARVNRLAVRRLQ
jgi:hypothetical protein